jgi:hypothetical protein
MLRIAPSTINTQPKFGAVVETKSLENRHLNWYGVPRKPSAQNNIHTSEFNVRFGSVFLLEHQQQPGLRNSSRDVAAFNALDDDEVRRLDLLPGSIDVRKHLETIDKDFKTDPASVVFIQFQTGISTY